MMPEAEIKKSRFSLIWLIPAVALLTGIWMLYDHYTNKGLKITIEFKNGEGITAGKTALKYAGIQIGMVQKVGLTNDFSSVSVEAVLDKEFSHFAKKDSLFWLVKPRLEVGAISGIETIFTGQYIAVRPGDGPKSYSFKALDQPPPSSENAPGLHLLVKAKTLGGIVSGSPVSYKKIKVGKVESHHLSENGESILIKILISPKYKKLVTKDTRFWNVSGVEVSGDLSGIKIKADSLPAVLDGGIAFDTPENGDKKSLPAVNNDEFILYDNKERAMEKGFPIKIEFQTGEGLVENSTPLKYKGITIGKVCKIDINKDSGKITATVLVHENAKKAASENSKFWMVRPRLNLKGISGLNTIISGQYIEVQPAPGKFHDEFKALTEPPFSDPLAPGLHLVLKAGSKQGLLEGSPVYTRGIEAGRVEGYALSPEGVDISIHIYQKYSHLVSANTRFWNESGLKITGDLTGINIESKNLESLVSGAVAFDTPKNEQTVKISSKTFKLYQDKNAALSAGRSISIIFKNAQSLKKGITPLKYKGIEIGKVTDIFLTPDMEKVRAQIDLFPNAPYISRKGSVFYTVSPQINFKGLTGIETLFSGAYINSFMGSGEYKKEFEALDNPPSVHPDMKGKEITIHAPLDNYFKPGTPLFYSGMEAGIIKTTNFSKSRDKIIMQALIYDDFKDFVSSKTRFFNISGFKIKTDLLKIQLESRPLDALITGGIGFKNIKDDSLKKEKNSFCLYQSQEKAMEKGFFINLILDQAKGLKENNTKIVYKGFDIGKIEKINFNALKNNFSAKAFIIEEAKNLVKSSSKFYLQKPEFSINKIKNPETVLTGIYIELIKGNGTFQDEFKVFERPVPKGLEIILEAQKPGSLSPGKPVMYKQIEVGQITKVELSQTFDKVLIYAVIENKYTDIVRKNSKFWYSGGIHAKINLLGAEIKTGTIESILKGGVEFATPNNSKMGEKSENNDKFILHEMPENDWLEWRPVIEKKETKDN
jgi:paraquat-inducible protein B